MGSQAAAGVRCWADGGLLLFAGFLQFFADFVGFFLEGLEFFFEAGGFGYEAGAAGLLLVAAGAGLLDGVEGFLDDVGGEGGFFEGAGDGLLDALPDGVFIGWSILSRVKEGGPVAGAGGTGVGASEVFAEHFFGVLEVGLFAVLLEPALEGFFVEGLIGTAFLWFRAGFFLLTFLLFGAAEFATGFKFGKVGAFAEFYFQHLFFVAALDVEFDGVAGFVFADVAGDALHVAFDGLSADAEEEVVFLEAGFVGGAAGEHLPDGDFAVVFRHGDAEPCGGVGFLYRLRGGVLRGR